MERSGKQFVEFWDWAFNKGLMKENTAKSLAVASKQIISVDENWETLDVLNIDVDDLLARFKNLRGKDFKPDSLNVYEHRFRQAVDLFLQHSRDPANWKFKGKTSNRKAKSDKSDDQRNSPQDSENEIIPPNTVSSNSLIVYPFPLRDNCMIKLNLPSDLKVAEVERLAAYIRTLALDFKPSGG